ncbi:MAG: hypothetical protein V7L01_34560 [Nostoc sp.]|uniref:hypothetical protein n=1 Tax=Nostoc sp. TaxID=1180 RepID=UPI002FFC9342
MPKINSAIALFFNLQFNAHIPSTVAPRRLENSERYRGSSDWIASDKAIHLWRYFFFKL